MPCAAKACSGAASVCTCPTRVAERPDSQGGLSDDAGGGGGYFACEEGMQIAVCSADGASNCWRDGK